MAGLCEPSIDKTSVTVRIPLELCYKVIGAFSQEGDSFDSAAFTRALTVAAGSEKLTKEDMAEIKRRKSAIKEKRMKNRKARDEAPSVKAKGGVV